MPVPAAIEPGGGCPATSLRAGVTLPELIVVAWLFGLVLAAAASFAGAQGRLVARTHDGARVAEVARTASVVLGSELRSLAPPDVPVRGPDSLRLRAIRGGGPVCAATQGAAGASIVVRYRGVRRPEPDKDSVLVIHARSTDGRAAALTAVAADPECDDGLRLRIDGPPPPAGGWALVFEPGTYHLSGGALRYRRGAAGRQPLTEAVLADARMAPGDRTLSLWLRFHPDTFPRLSAARAVRTVRLGRVPELP